MHERITLGVSACLLGQNVRYDGGHKLDRFIRDTLGRYVDFVPVCPEVECGLPIPREAMRLVGNPASPRLMTIRSQKDLTGQMERWGKTKLDALANKDLCGYIFKSRSPSSGMARVKVYNDKGQPEPKGVGIWAGMFMERFPDLPVEDEGRLHDPVLRENFINRIFVVKRWQDLLRSGKDLGELIRFHTRHKLLLMAHHEPSLRRMGRLLAGGKGADREELFAEYERLLMYSLGLKTTVKKNVNVLYHAMGYFKKDLSQDEKAELREVIDSYAQELLPLIVPVTLINHFVRKYEQPYLREQYYLNPHPLELKLRNHV